jgi:hypothetical protein
MDALQSAIRQLVERHEALRTVFTDMGEQQILCQQEIEVVAVDAAGDAKFDAWLAGEVARRFDTATGPLLRMFAVDRGDEVHDLVLLVHHLVCDGWSMAVLVDELAAAYGAACAGKAFTAGAPMQFCQFLNAQADRISDAQREAWAHALDGHFLTPALLPGVVRDGTASRAEATLDAELRHALMSVGAKYQCTLFMVLLAAHSLAVHALTGQRRVVIGSPTTGRTFPGAESVVGYCSHLLPIVTAVDDDTTIADHLGAVRDTVLAALARTDTPLSVLRRTIEGGHPGPFPFDTIFNLDRAIACPPFAGLGSHFERVSAPYALVPLRVDAQDTGDGVWLDCDVAANVDDLDPARFLGAFRAMIDTAVRDAAGATFGALLASDDSRIYALTERQDT